METKRILSSEEFIEIWKGSFLNDPSYKMFYEETNIEFSNLDNSITFRDKTYIVNFRNIEVKGMVNLADEREYLPINLSEVIFHDLFQLQKGVFANFFIGKNRGNNIFKKGLNIFGGEFKNSISLSSIGSDEEHCEITIHGGVFETKLRVWSSNKCKLNISSGNFKGGISFSGLFQSIIITGGIYSRDLELERLIVYEDFQVIGGYFSKRITNGGEWAFNQIPKFLTFLECGIIKLGSIGVIGNFVISSVECNYINFSIPTPDEKEYSFINNFHIIGFSKNVFIQSTENNHFFLNKLYFENSTILAGNVFRLDNIKLESLIFKNVICQGNLFMNRVFGGYVYSLSLKTEENLYKKLVINDDNLTKKNKQSEFIIQETDFGNSIFFNCNFSEFKMLFDSSKLDNLYLSGSILPPNVSTVVRENYIQEKYAYNQLKRVYAKNDIFKANEYEIKEIESYRNYLQANKEHLGDRIILFLNKITSNHNTNWMVSLFWLFVFNAIAFSLLLYCLDFELNFTQEGFNNFINLFSYSFSFLNPIHRTDFLSNGFKNILWNPKAELVDGISRIINAFLIYQFIQSFRKFGRK